MRRYEIVAEARRWIGTPYRHKGRSAHGLDCIGLLVVVARALAVAHTDESHYIDWPDPERRIVAVLSNYLDIAGPHSGWDGSVGLFTQDRLPGHVGIFSTRDGGPHVIHAHIGHRRIVEEPFPSGAGAQPMRMVRRFQLPGVEA